MNAKLNRIDETAAILTSLYDNGRISEARYLAAIKALTAKAWAILAKQAAK